MQNAQSIAVDTDNVAHVVVKATTLTDPTTPAVGSSDNLNRTELDLQQAKTSDSAAALTSLTGVNTQTAGGISALPIFHSNFWKNTRFSSSEHFSHFCFLSYCQDLILTFTILPMASSHHHC